MVVRDTSVSETVRLPLLAIAMMSTSKTTAPTTHRIGLEYHSDISGPVVVVVVWVEDELDCEAAPPSWAKLYVADNANANANKNLLLIV